MDHSFLAIDELQLDVEWAGQPLLYMEYAEKLANAKQVLDEAQIDFEVLECDLLAKIRAKPTKYGLDAKPTESAVKSTMPMQAEWKAGREEINKAKHRVDVLSAAVTALEHRKRALTKLVDLRAQEYFSEPTASKGGKEALGEAAKKRVRTLGQRKDKDTAAEDDED